MEDDRVNGMDDEDKEDEKEEGGVVERIIRHDKHVKHGMTSADPNLSQCSVTISRKDSQRTLTTEKCTLCNKQTNA